MVHIDQGQLKLILVHYEDGLKERCDSRILKYLNDILAIMQT